MDGPESLENDLCIVGAPPAPKLRPELGPLKDGLAVARPEPSDLSRPSSRLLAVGEISTATIAVTTAARDLIILSANILILLHAPE
jgi:hypothetical protein